MLESYLELLCTSLSLVRLPGNILPSVNYKAAFGRIMTLNHNLYKIMNVEGYGILMVKISVELSWNFTWKVFTTGQMFTRLTYFQHHWPALNFTNAAVFLQ